MCLHQTTSFSILSFSFFWVHFVSIMWVVCVCVCDFEWENHKSEFVFVFVILNGKIINLKFCVCVRICVCFCDFERENHKSLVIVHPWFPGGSFYFSSFQFHSLIFSADPQIFIIFQQFLYVGILFFDFYNFLYLSILLLVYIYIYINKK